MQLLSVFLGTLLVLVRSGNGVSYGPSLEYLTSENDFSSGGAGQRRVVKLADYAPTYSVVIPLAHNKTSAEPHLVRPVGEFAVEAPENMRVMAVIQSLHLRKKSFTSAFPPVCRDYIVFGDDHINKVCGDVMKNDRKGAPLGMMGDRTFFSPTNILNVTVYTDMSTFVETWMNIPNVIEIAFTAYQSCPFYDPDERLFNCLENIIPYGPSCISSNLTCDGVVNCGFLSDGTYGKDEADCPNSSFNVNNNSETVPTTPRSSTVIPLHEPKTGFPSWWENWRKMQLDEANSAVANNANKNNLNLLNLGGAFVESENKGILEGSSNVDNNNGDLYSTEIRRTGPTNYFEPEYKSSVNYFNSFALYALCFYAGVSGIFVILKVAMRYCADDSASSVSSSTNLMRDSSSSLSVSNESDGSPMSVRSHPPIDGPYGPVPPRYTPPDLRDFELPPSYESLFPNGSTSSREECVVDLSTDEGTITTAVAAPVLTTTAASPPAFPSLLQSSTSTTSPPCQQHVQEP